MRHILAAAMCLISTSAVAEPLPDFINSCWNIGALSSEALDTVIAVSFKIDADRMPEPDSIELVGSHGTERGAQQAFEAARRAILRCSLAKGGLPFEGDTVTLVFGPDDTGEMSIRISPRSEPLVIEAVAVGSPFT